MKDKQLTRDEQIVEIANKQGEIMSLITWVTDSYPEYAKEGKGNLIVKELSGAADSLHKILLDVVQGKTAGINTVEKTTE
jgi:hypothetical protein